MSLEPPDLWPLDPAQAGLHVYLLGLVDYEAILQLQRRLVYDVSADRGMGALILCEHPPIITIGRHGSRAHVLCEPEELRARRWEVRWVNRGGGCLLQVPGQLAFYSILALDRLRLSVPAYVDRLREVITDVLTDYRIPSEPLPASGSVRVEGRSIAEVGVAVRDWVAYHGGVLNVNPSLRSFRLVHCGGGEGTMTSLERERRGPVRPALVKERLMASFAERFGFARTALFSDHPLLNGRAMRCHEPAVTGSA